VAIYPSDSFKAALKTIREVYETLIEERSQENVLDRMVEWGERDEITGLGEINRQEETYEESERAYQEQFERMD